MELHSRKRSFPILTSGAIVLLVALSFISPLAIAGSQSASPVLRALLIGINKYQNAPQLAGSINDIEKMRQILITRFGFSDQHIRTLRDEAATRAGILKALEQLVTETGPEDVVYIHYSGHGSRFEGKDGTIYETIIPQDGRTGKIPDITDEEVQEIISRLRARNALIVLDSCHSGPVTRAVSVGTRAIPPDTRLYLYQSKTVKTRSLGPRMKDRYVVMAAARADQPALDGPIDGKFHGAFSYALSQSLSRRASSARDVFAGIGPELKRIQSQLGTPFMPEPQLGGPPDKLNRPLLQIADSSSTPPGDLPRLPWVEVRPVDTGRVLLTNAVNMGALPGSIWAIYPPGETRFRPGKAKALATIIEARGYDSIANIEPRGQKISSGSRAVAQAPPPPPNRVPVLFRDVSSKVREELSAVLRRQLDTIDVVSPGTFARFVMDVQRNTLNLYGPDGLKKIDSFDISSSQWAEGVAKVMSRSLRVSDLMALENPSSHLVIETSVATGITSATTRGVTNVADVADVAPSQYRIRRKGEPRTAENSLQLQIRASGDSYLTIVDVDSDGIVNLLFPNEFQKPGFYPDGKLRGRESVFLPDSLASGNLSGFHWDYSPPPGMDTIRIFASTDFKTAKTIRDYVRDISASQRMMVRTRGGPLHPAGIPISKSFADLRTTLSKIAIRGIMTVPDEVTQVSGGSGTGSIAPTPDGLSQEGQSGLAQTAADWSATTITVQVAE